MKRSIRYLLILVLSLVSAFLLATAAFADEIQVGVVTGNGVNLRSAPSTGSTVLLTVAKNNQVAVLGSTGDWYQVTYSGKTGYMSADYVKVNAPAEVTVTDNLYGSVTGSAVYLRSAASTSGTIRASLLRGTKVEILSTDGNWYQVSYAGQTGYMCADYISLSTTAVTVEKEPTYGYVSGSAVYVRSTASTSGIIKTSLLRGTKVEILGTTGDWYRIDHNGTQGYMSRDYVSLTEIKPLSPGEQIVQIAKKYIGYRYVWGGSSPSTGFDCSGLVTWVFREYNGFKFKSRTSLYLDGTRILRDALKPGDLVFFDTVGNGSVSHVGIYIGNNEFIHAPNARSRVRIDSMAYGSYYYWRYKGARRIF